MEPNGRTGYKDSRENCTGTEGSKNMEEKYLICEDSLEGIWTGIYEAYAGKWGHEHTHLLVGEEDNYRLFATYVNIVADAGKADKVSRTLRQRLGDEVYLELCRAAASCQPEASYPSSFHPAKNSVAWTFSCAWIGAGRPASPTMVISRFTVHFQPVFPAKAGASAL